jgi:murein DD-endopeptidase MepM/ murein hydrolase activator NlpD
MQLGKETKTLKRIQPGDKVSFRIEDNQLQELSYKYSATEKLVVSKLADSFKTKHIKREFSKQVSHTSGEITHSLFLAAQKAGLSDNMTMELAGIFGWDIDFALDIREGDRFTVIYEENYLDGKKVSDGNILAATFTNRNKTFKAIRYTDAKGHTGYYSEEGRNMRKAFLRTPVEFSRISSRFNLRRKHPILNRIRAHTGVDYAAPRGTPVRATGDGKIVHRGRKGGYGNTVIIRHGSRYSTLYAHLSNYNRKAKRGSKVKQGQIIGYIGSSGLATGPHLHYEFRANGVHRNPLTVRFPKSAPINKKYLADFMHKAKPMLAQLEMLNSTQVAMQ